MRHCDFIHPWFHCLQLWKDHLKKEDGEINMVAIVLIILVVIALIAIFRDNLTALLDSLFKKIESEAMKI